MQSQSTKGPGGRPSLKVECTCVVCGGTFRKKRSQIAQGAGLVCRWACYLANRTASPAAFSARFWARVDLEGPIPEHAPELGSCWVWTGARQSTGYGHVAWNGKPQLAHRVAWTLEVGPIPDRMLLCHRCDNPPCVRPSHIFLGGHRENGLDAHAKGRHPVGTAARGEAHGRAKLTADDVREIRARFASGERQRSLSRAFGVGQSQIARIVYRETWRHV